MIREADGEVSRSARHDAEFQSAAERPADSVGLDVSGESGQRTCDMPSAQEASACGGSPFDDCKVPGEIRRNPELRTMFSVAKNATPDEIRQYINVIKAIRGEE